MDISYIFDSYKADNNKLLEYGFKKQNNTYIYEYLYDDKTIYYIVDNKFKIRVVDNDTSLDYLPFSYKDVIGSYNSNLHDIVDNILKDITSKCLIASNIKDEIVSYAINTYKSTIDYPFKDDSIVLRKNGKWYGLMMNIPYKSLGLNRNDRVDIINLKTNNIIVDNIHYFNAYHMNKDKWITIVLDSSVDKDKLKEYIDKSYNLVK